jgi:hypothetical protein
MRRITCSILCSSLLLVSCGSATQRFTLHFDLTDAKLQQELTEATSRMVKRRLEAQKKSLVKSEVSTVDGSTVITVTASDAQGMATLKDSLLQPFTLEVMRQVEKGQGDIISEKFGEFKETGLTGKDVTWVSPGIRKFAGQERGFVDVIFSEEGTKKLQEVFRQNMGGVIGVFVRGLLVSKKIVEESDPKQSGMTIDNIPSAGLAEAFADDVNIGLHVTFTAE